jgi:DNA-binding MarR family transcriptional regulator
MSQESVYQFLKKHPKRLYTTKMLSEKLNVSRGSVTNNVKRLSKNGFIDLIIKTKTLMNIKLKPYKKEHYYYRFKT